MLADPMFWYAVAFVIFAALAYWKVRKPLLSAIDAQIEKIRDELARAKQLRAEAEAMLAEYKKKYAEAIKEAEEIISYAKEEAKELREQAADELKAALARHEQQAAERIRLAETEALAAVRGAAIDEAMSSARKTLETGSSAGALADQAIADLPKIAGKAKAA